MAGRDGSSHFCTEGILMTDTTNTESPEGLDRKMVVSYYCRLRFATNLIPLLKAGSSSESARVISVLAPGREGPLIMGDLGLHSPKNFSLRNVEYHTVTMTSLAFEHLASEHPDIGWIHAYPSVVVTGLARGLPAPLRIAFTVMTPLVKLFAVPIGDCGHGFAWLGTDEKFRRGLWLVDWKGDSMDSRKPEGKRMINSGVEWWGEAKRKGVWEHTQEVFRSVKAPGA